MAAALHDGLISHGSVLEQRQRLEVIGTDDGGLAALPAAALRLVQQAELVAGPARLLAQLPPDQQRLATEQPQQACQQLAEAWQAGRRAVLLASGDPLWFGIGRLLLQYFDAADLRFHPAPSSLQLAFARIGRPWQDARWVSLHGREPEPLAAELQQRPSALAVLTDPGQGGVEEVRRTLAALGLEAAYALWLCERLGHPQERVQQLAPTAALPADLDPLHLVLLLAQPPAAISPTALPLFGIADGQFLQHHDHPGLMTKREVRVQLLADLELPQRGVLWDLGAGTGSVGLEALRLCPALELWAVERRSGGAALVRANAERLGVSPAAVLEGEALQMLAQMPTPQRVLLGGGGRQRAALLQAVIERLAPGGLVVIPLATLEPVAELRPLLEAAGWRVSLTQLNISRGVPLAGGLRLAPLNPVLVLRGCQR